MSNTDDDVIVYADMVMKGSMAFSQVIDFPTSPSIGTFIVKDGILYGYLDIQGVYGWCPFGKIPFHFVHVQSIPSKDWVILHNLKSTNVWVQVKDSVGLMVDCAVDVISENDIALHFLTPISGSAIIMANPT